MKEIERQVITKWHHKRKETRSGENGPWSET